jgi:hypothetical protein
MIKLRRRHVAKEMHVLADMVKGLMSEVQRLGNREPDFTARSLNEAHDLVKAAVTSVSVAADEFTLFARNRVYYVKEL